ncbi:MAG: hypothetical protein IPJ75_17870 [Ignavibacteriales bacterium]|nr:hypothetical protein [Ignavibacteriales bacterium]
MLNGQADYTLNITDRETKQNTKSAEVWFITGDGTTGGKFFETKLDLNSASGILLLIHSNQKTQK